MSMQRSAHGERKELVGHTALVTGGAIRIGAEICRALADAGADLVIHYRRSRKAAVRLAREIVKRGARADFVGGSLDTEVGCCRVIEQAFRKSGGLTILVNNAAVFHKDTMATLSEKILLRDFRTNLFGPLILIREFARLAKQGVIINLLDRRVSGFDVSCVPYVLTKKALADVTRIAALALAPRIRVNAVAPGPVLPPPGKTSAYMREKAGPVPLQCGIAPRDVAEAVVYLAKARTVTGQILFVDGGQGLLGEGSFEREKK